MGDSREGQQLTSGSFAAAYDRLSRAQKDNAVGGAPYSRFINRPLGRVFAAAAFRAGRSPNQVTMISGLTTLLGICVLAVAPATLVTGLAVTTLLLLGYALDSADGQLARLRGGGSAAGEWLDHLMDSAKLASIHLAVLITWYRHFDLGSDLLLLIPIGFSIAQCVGFSGLLLTELMLRLRQAAARPSVPFAPPTRAGSRHPVLVTVARLPLDYGITCLTFVLLGLHDAFVVVYGVMALATLGFLLLALPRYFGRLQDASSATV